MKICLKTLAKQEARQHMEVELKERLPANILGPSRLQCDFTVVSQGNYYLMDLDIKGALTVICQRCLEEFPHDYHHITQLAVCANDEIAERLMAQYESVVMQENQVDLVDILTDDLYLFSPHNHPHAEDCDQGVNALIVS